MDQYAVIEQMKSMIGQEIGVSDWFLIDQNRINQFCECTEDNPIFVDSRIRSRMVLTDVEEKTPERVLVTTKHTIEIEGANEPACIVEIIGLFILK